MSFYLSSCQTHILDIHANILRLSTGTTYTLHVLFGGSSKKNWEENAWKETENESMSQEYQSTGCKKHAPGAGGAQYPTACHSTVQEERLERLSTGLQKQE